MEENKQTLYYDELLSILPDGVIIFDVSGEVIQLNRQALTELHVHPSVNEILPLPTNHLFKLQEGRYTLDYPAKDSSRRKNIFIA